MSELNRLSATGIRLPETAAAAVSLIALLWIAPIPTAASAPNASPAAANAVCRAGLSSGKAYQHAHPPFSADVAVLTLGDAMIFKATADGLRRVGARPLATAFTNLVTALRKLAVAYDQGSMTDVNTANAQVSRVGHQARLVASKTRATGCVALLHWWDDAL